MIIKSKLKKFIKSKNKIIVKIIKNVIQKVSQASRVKMVNEIKLLLKLTKVFSLHKLIRTISPFMCRQKSIQ